MATALYVIAADVIRFPEAKVEQVVEAYIGELH